MANRFFFMKNGQTVQACGCLLMPQGPRGLEQCLDSSLPISWFTNITMVLLRTFRRVCLLRTEKCFQLFRKKNFA